VFENIGGCAWSRDLKVRFGNGFEIWHKGNDILIENCFFKNVYDSCVTHQGPGEITEPTKNFICRNCTFDTYGMAAFEYRDKLPINSSFTGNTCLNAGCGFAMLGEELPRYSEIWPDPMGHHIFMWRMPKATEGGSFEISGNQFYDATGAAVYSIISPEAEAQMNIHDNQYWTGNQDLFQRVNDKNYAPAEFDAYMEEWSDTGSVWTAEPDLLATAQTWLAKIGCSQNGTKLFTDELTEEKND
jgi:hypothetical protein